MYVEVGDDSMLARAESKNKSVISYAMLAIIHFHND